VASTKISVSLEQDQLKKARRAAKSEGVSLSAYLSAALATKLEEQERLDAARELFASWGPEAAPTAEERRRFLEQMARPKKRRRRAA